MGALDRAQPGEVVDGGDAGGLASMKPAGPAHLWHVLDALRVVQ